MIKFQIENKLNIEEFKEILEKSTLGERRPMKEPLQLEEMLKNANLIITARDEKKLVGISRSLTDFGFCTYLSDLAVDINYQNRGIGKELIRQTKLATPKTKLILLSAPKAISFYTKIGMSNHKDCYFLDDLIDLK